MIKRLARRLFDDSARTAARKAADSLALSHLQEIDIGIGFMPWTRAAMRPSTILHILNEIFINDRRMIIEFGSGISTLYLAWAARATGARMVSIEEDEAWSTKIGGLLQQNGLDGHCDLEAVERRDVNMNGYTCRWYDVDQVRRIVGRELFDLVVVDGPTAFQKGNETARRPALDVLRGHLAENYAIFLDDATRPGEKQVLEAWEASLGLKASLEPVAGGHAFLGSGRRYYSGL